VRTTTVFECGEVAMAVVGVIVAALVEFSLFRMSGGEFTQISGSFQFTVNFERWMTRNDKMYS
jgi:hypothetical protein